MSKVPTAAFDVAEYLETPADIAAYLQVSFEDGEPVIIKEALGAVARAKGMSDIARDAGMSRESLYRALSGDGNPSFGTIMNVMGALGVRLTVEPVELKRGRTAKKKAVSSSKTLPATRLPARGQ